MALLPPFGLVLGFASTVVVSLALGNQGASLRPVRFSCNYVSYTAKGTDFEQSTWPYVCFRRSSGPGKGQRRSIYFRNSGSGMRTRGTPGPGDELVGGGRRYLVMRVVPNFQTGIDYVWAEPIK
jgi:hypothetical protein